MYKLVILFESSDDGTDFDSQWPEFLHLAEEMPDLRREATGRVARFFYGQTVYSRVHELFFDSLEDAEAAMASPVGREAGKLLQKMTGGHMNLFLVEHREDGIENILKYKQLDDKAE